MSKKILLLCFCLSACNGEDAVGPKKGEDAVGPKKDGLPSAPSTASSIPSASSSATLSAPPSSAPSLPTMSSSPAAVSMARKTPVPNNSRKSACHGMHSALSKIEKKCVETGLCQEAAGHPDNISAMILFPVESGDIKLVECLIERGADLNKRHAEEGFTLLFAAMARDNPPLIKLLINKGSRVNVNYDTIYGIPHIFFAFSKSLETFQALIEGGADLTLRAADAWTPLIFAAHYDKLEHVKLLMDAGADFCARTIQGNTALMTAEHNGHLRIVRLLRGHKRYRECRL